MTNSEGALAALREKKLYIFDMDGTLLHTLPDLAAVTNKALDKEGFPPHTEEEIRTFVGNGALALARCACRCNRRTGRTGISQLQRALRAVRT